ncbi:hypothetical protein BGZ58_008209 [Dissophora ornata]|nr:hypothetical protein BGZ58_008209 [Dissophora ornata]
MLLVPVIFKVLIVLGIIADIVVTVTYHHARQRNSAADSSFAQTWPGLAAIILGGTALAIYTANIIIDISVQPRRRIYMNVLYLAAVFAGFFLLGVTFRYTDVEFRRDPKDPEDSVVCVHSGGDANLCNLAMAAIGCAFFVPVGVLSDWIITGCTCR